MFEESVKITNITFDPVKMVHVRDVRRIINNDVMAEGVIGCSDFGCIQDTVMGVADRLLDSDDATNLSDTENSCEIDADYVEEQFRVDRRKLEVMIQEGEFTSSTHAVSLSTMSPTRGYM